MKYLILILISLPILSYTQVVEWQDDQDFDFGQLVQGQPEEVVFTFKNISTDTLIIDNIRSTCGCTAPYWDYSPILPDSTSQITLKYDAYKSGYFYKKVKVFFNKQRKAETLSITGQVLSLGQ
jgi:hypothetical protein